MLQQGIHCSPFGVIPKKHRPDAWRLIVDLSHTENDSVNDGINKELYSLSYVPLGDVIANRERGHASKKGYQTDISQCLSVPSRQVAPWNVLERHGLCGRNITIWPQICPSNYSALAEALTVGVQQRGVQQVFYYIDDFITIGAPGIEECERNDRVMHGLCQELGLPVADEKDE